MRRTTTTRTRGGFSLVELTVTVGLLGLVLGSLAMMSLASDRAYKTSSMKTHLEGQSMAALDRVLDELRLAVGDSVQPAIAAGEATGAIEYAHAVGIDAAKLVLTPRRRLAVALEVGELDDGVDNNGNGLVDERRLVLTEDVGQPGERDHVVTRWVSELLAGEEENGVDDNGNGLVDEPGFAIAREGRTLMVHLTLAKVDGEGRRIQRTVRSSTSMRN